MKKLFFMIAFALIGFSASAQTCADFSGFYKDTDTDFVRTTLEIEQVECAKITMRFTKNFDSGTIRSWTKERVTDGISREVTPGLLSEYVFFGNKLNWKDKLIQSQHSQTGSWYFDQDDNLVADGYSYPSGVFMKITYRRIQSDL